MEAKILYKDGDKERVIRGEIIEKDGFIEIHRRDGVIQLNKAIVLKIEKRKEEVIDDSANYKI